MSTLMYICLVSLLILLWLSNKSFHLWAYKVPIMGTEEPVAAFPAAQPWDWSCSSSLPSRKQCEHNKNPRDDLPLELQGINNAWKHMASANLSPMPYGKNCYIISKSTVQTLWGQRTVHIHTDPRYAVGQVFISGVKIYRKPGRKWKVKLLDVTVIYQHGTTF